MMIGFDDGVCGLRGVVLDPLALVIYSSRLSNEPTKRDNHIMAKCNHLQGTRWKQGSSRTVS